MLSAAASVAWSQSDSICAVSSMFSSPDGSDSVWRRSVLFFCEVKKKQHQGNSEKRAFPFSLHW